MYQKATFFEIRKYIYIQYMIFIVIKIPYCKMCKMHLKYGEMYLLMLMLGKTNKQT